MLHTIVKKRLIRERGPRDRAGQEEHMITGIIVIGFIIEALLLRLFIKAMMSELPGENRYRKNRSAGNGLFHIR